MPERILFLDDHGRTAAPLACSLLRARGLPLIEVLAAGVSPATVSAPLLAHPAELGVDSPAGRSLADLRAGFTLIISLSEAARAACRAEGSDPSHSVLRAGAPLLLHWQLDALDDLTALQAELRRRVDVLVDHGYLDVLRLAQQRLDRIVDGIDSGLLVHDADRRIYVFNRAAERMTGLSREQVLGRDCHEVFGGTGLCGESCQFKDKGAGPPGVQQREVRVITADGVDASIKMRVDINRSSEDAGAHVIASLKDLTEVKALREELRDRYGLGDMIGVGAGMQEVFERIRQVAGSDYPALVTGESGVGKELVARAIHDNSRRREGPFVPINCGALPEHILESELFGHVRGAFTGAHRDRKGRFELADGGTLFLDEVGELDPVFQVKLLRVLQEKCFERVGDEKPIRVDVRIISATNRDLLSLVREGRFREDLFYRLAVVPIELPPLRERREDIPFLIDKILADVRGESGTQVRSVDDEALACLMSHRWPGNVRELINALRYASVRCQGDRIGRAHLPLEVQLGMTERDDDRPPMRLAPQRRAAAQDLPPPRGQARLSPEIVEQALASTRGNKLRAAKQLGVGRATLYRYLRQHHSDT